MFKTESKIILSEIAKLKWTALKLREIIFKSRQNLPEVAKEIGQSTSYYLSTQEKPRVAK
jgi:hypothetical protein